MKHKRIILLAILLIAFSLPYAGLVFTVKHFEKERVLIKNAEFVIDSNVYNLYKGTENY